jgi:hypothetical protein
MVIMKCNFFFHFFVFYIYFYSFITFDEHIINICYCMDSGQNRTSIPFLNCTMQLNRVVLWLRMQKLRSQLSQLGDTDPSLLKGHERWADLGVNFSLLATMHQHLNISKTNQSTITCDLSVDRSDLSVISNLAAVCRDFYNLLLNFNSIPF